MNGVEMMVLKRWVALFAIVIFILTSGQMVLASAIPYRSYTYNQWGDPVESPAGYEPLGLVDGDMLGVGRLNQPEDFYVTKDKQVYILDTGNNRVIITNSYFKSAEVLEKLRTTTEESTLNKPQGIFVDSKGFIFIADTDNKRIIKIDREGNIKNVYTKPTSELYPAGADFVPLKVITDTSGIVYAICKGISNGAVMYSPEGDFLGYYGSNKVDRTLKLRIDRFWKSILSEKQKEKMPTYISVEFSNLAIDNEDFVYTCTLNSQNPANMIRKINPLGLNILENKVYKSFQGGFGDWIYYHNLIPITTRLIDLCVDEKGHITALDFTRGRVFQYDQDANLIFAFGGLGNQLGMLLSPAAIDTIGENLLVLDRSTGSITVFQLTEFGRKVHEGIALYNDGRYIESVEPWNEVLKLDSNYNLAYIGLGKAMLELGEYEKAMKYFKTGHYSIGYNSAYNEFRRVGMRSNFKYIFILVVIILIFVFGNSMPPVRRFFYKLNSRSR